MKIIGTPFEGPLGFAAKYETGQGRAFGCLKEVWGKGRKGDFKGKGKRY